jgi:ferredoxin
MKCIIIYFSQTGNTDRVARAIQTGIEQVAGNCDLVKIKAANPHALQDYDLIGIGSPVMAWEPDNVGHFVDSMRSVAGKHAFAFNTHGLLPGGFFPHIYPRLTNRGLTVIGMRDWFGSVILSHCPKPYPSDGHPDETDLKEAENFGREMVENSRKISDGDTNLIPPMPASFDDEPIPWFVPPEFMHVFRTKVRYHEERCNYPKCRICVDNCPVDGIDLSVSPPTIANPCLDCEWCTHLCPTGALEAYDFFEWCEPLFYQHLRLYHTILASNEEARGNLRRLVAPKDVGWDTSVGRLILRNVNKHPHYRIGRGLTLRS